MDGCGENIRNLEDVILRRQLTSTIASTSLGDPVQTTIPVVRTKRTNTICVIKAAGSATVITVSRRIIRDHRFQ